MAGPTRSDLPDHTVEEMIHNIFQLQSVESNVLRANPGHIYGMFGKGGRLFGGQTVAQSFLSAKSLAKERHVHSLHLTFLAAGTAVDPIDYEIHEVGDGRTQRVYARQKGRFIAHSFIRSSTEQELYPSVVPRHLADVGDWECYPGAENILNAGVPGRMKNVLRYSPFELRIVDFPGLSEKNRMVMWARIRPKHKELLKVHTGLETALLFTDFYALAAPSEVQRSAGYQVSTGASINHHVYFHKESIDPLQWFLYSMEFTSASFDRSHLRIHVCDENKELVFSARQEAYLVARRPKEKSKKEVTETPSSKL